VIRPTTRGSSIPVKSLQVEGTMTHASDMREQTLLSYAGSSAALRLPSISARQDFWCEVPGVWGEAGTACASDSTKIGAWDQNLMAEWHVRYQGRGVITPWTML